MATSRQRTARRRFKSVLKKTLIGALVLAGAIIVMLLFTAWRALFPTTYSTGERLEAFPSQPLPLDDKVSIYWDDYQIPFIEAQTDHDAAFVLGLVHCHLRWGQMAVYKRVSQGRLAEMAGPPAARIDEALRTLDLGYAAKGIIDSLDTDTRNWLETFVEGVNYYMSNADDTPPEFGLLGIEPEPFTLVDLITLSRLAGADVNWIHDFVLLRQRRSPEWEENWQRILQAGTGGTATFEKHRSFKDLDRLITGLSRSGSNSVAVAASRSANGHAMIANDPHLGISIPNLWLLAGVSCPSYHCVGMMIPGLPFFALGRNPYLAWGGTNMHSASSDLYDVSSLPPDSFSETVDTIKVRWWRDETIRVRRTPYGPVMTDARAIPAPATDTVALKWVGHQVSDDLGAFLRANRATTIPEFVEAFKDYAVSGQNMLVVDTSGNIAMTMAVRLPVRTYQTPPDVVLEAGNPAHEWQGFLDAPELPVAVNPPEGFIASANNKPTDNDPPIGFLFSQSERIDRLRTLMSARDTVDLEYLESLQQDVYSATSYKLSRAWLRAIDNAGLGGGEHKPFVDVLSSWDGYYRTDERGPVAFEMLTYHLVRLLLTGDRNSYFYRSWTYVSNYLPNDLTEMDKDEQRVVLDSALTRAERDAGKFADWGEMHHLKAGYLLSRIPAIGSLFTYDDFPVAGSRETVMKTNHEITNERSYTSYGSQSRHISVMDDPDHNMFTLMGGNDGWLGSENVADQIGLWKRGEYIQLPLTLEKVRHRARFEQTLSPGGTVTLTENSSLAARYANSHRR